MKLVLRIALCCSLAVGVGMAQRRGGGGSIGGGFRGGGGITRGGTGGRFRGGGGGSGRRFSRGRRIHRQLVFAGAAAAWFSRRRRIHGSGFRGAAGSIGSGFRGGGGGFRGGGGIGRFWGFRGDYGGYYGSYYSPYFYSGYGLGYGYGPWYADYGYSSSSYPVYSYPVYQPSPNVTVVYRAARAGAHHRLRGAHRSAHSREGRVRAGDPPAHVRAGFRFAHLPDCVPRSHRSLPPQAYWAEGGTLHYVTQEHEQKQAPLAPLDRDLSEQLNRERRVAFSLPASQ